MPPIKIRKSQRAKNYLLHVTLSGQVELVIPKYGTKKGGLAFLREREIWLQETLAKQASIRASIPIKQLTENSKISLLNHQFLLKIKIDPKRQKNTVTHTDNYIIASVKKQADLKSALTTWYKKQARLHFADQATILCERLKKPAPTISISGAKTRWGSCNKTQNKLMFNWKLMLGPSQVADYVVAHEVAHLIHANHSKKFWSLVEKLMPEYKKHKKWLKQHGHTLTI